MFIRSIFIFGLWFVTIDRTTGVPCSQCPAEIKKQVDIFCRRVWIFQGVCYQIISQNTDQQLISKACEPLGVCGNKVVTCNTCPAQFKVVLTSLCDTLVGRIDFGFWSTPFKDVCKLLIHFLPHNFFDASCVIGQGVVREPSWGYGWCNGPHKWAENLYAPNCKGNNQSPINLDSRIPPQKLLSLSTSFTSTKQLQGQLTNNGRTLVFTITTATAQTLTLNGNVYKPFKIEFRWGSTNAKGSEHTIDGKPSAMEMQVFLQNTKYGSPAQALGKSDGILILAFLFRVDSTNTIDVFKSDIGQITAATDQMTASVSTNVALNTFLDAVNLKGFYTYKGSTTTPGCNNNVDWIIFDKELAVSQEQMDAFRKLKNHDGSPMADNYRTQQVKSGRAVIRYKP